MKCSYFEVVLHELLVRGQCITADEARSASTGAGESVQQQEMQSTAFLAFLHL